MKRRQKLPDLTARRGKALTQAVSPLVFLCVLRGSITSMALIFKQEAYDIIGAAMEVCHGSEMLAKR
jgi:hypothetical protein